MRNICTYRVSNKVDLLVTLLRDSCCDFFRDIFSLAINSFVGKSSRLVLQVEHVEVGAGVLLLE